MVQRARDDPDLQGKLTGQILQIPKTCQPETASGGYPERCVLLIGAQVLVFNAYCRFRNKLLSYEQNKSDPVLTRETLAIFYGTDKGDAQSNFNTHGNFLLESYKAGPQSHLEVSPLLSESLSGLPAAYIQVAGADPLRDDGLCYAEQLEKAGVPVKLDMLVHLRICVIVLKKRSSNLINRYPGVPHGFASVFPQLKISQKWRDDFDVGVHWLLGNVSQSSA